MPSAVAICSAVHPMSKRSLFTRSHKAALKLFSSGSLAMALNVLDILSVVIRHVGNQKLDKKDG
jgi:hypothetical protein